MPVKNMEKFKITKKKDELDYVVKGKVIDVIDTLLDINVKIFMECIFDIDISIDDKFNVLDSFIKKMKRDIEQGIVYNS